MKIGLVFISYSVDDIAAGVAKLNTSAQKCSQEVLVRFEATIIL